MRPKAFLRASGLMSFNPRICKRCDNIKADTSKKEGVSIHASVKDATGETRELRFIYQVSIHASVKDATLATNALGMSMFSFNPRICKRCDWITICAKGD